MRIVPIARKVRELGRAREVRTQHEKQPSRWVALGVVFVLTVLLTAPSLWVDPVPVEPGTEIEEPLVASVGFEYTPPGAEERWREEASLKHTRVFVYNSEVKKQGVGLVSRVLARAAETNPDELVDPREFDATFGARENVLVNWTNEELGILVRLAQNERFRQRAELILEDIYGENYLISSADWTRLNSIREYAQINAINRPPATAPRELKYPEDTDVLLRNQVARKLDSVISAVHEDTQGQETPGDRFSMLGTETAKVAMRVIDLGLWPNLRFDPQQTEENLRNFPREKPERIERGAVLVGTDITSWPHALTSREAHLLETYAEYRARANSLRFLAEVLFVLIALLIISFFVIKFSRELIFDTQAVLLLSLPLLLALGLGRVFLLIGNESILAGYAFPAGVIGILGVLLLDVRLAILMVTLGCLLFGLEANLAYEYVIVGLFGGYTAVAALYTFRERREVIYAGLLIGFVNASTILILNTIGGEGKDPWAGAAIGALSGILCSLISFAVLPVFEVLFHITTDMRLLELSGLQHPLLRRMEEEAPGTLQHTMNVAKLAESAATAIGVNYLLVRAGVYFHDIGKMSKPEYFTENQLTPEDKRRHDDLRPQMSTLIIRNHVKEGIELANTYKLPPVVKQFIPEHHGTSRIQYFYHKALTAYERGEIKEPIREEDYRYPGPRPQSIESAVVMLADTVEATATAKLSGRVVRDDDIQMLVRNAITEKFNDGQFDDCNLTLRDLNIIRESFVKTLRSRFHQRIDYPGGKKAGEKEKAA